MCRIIDVRKIKSAGPPFGATCRGWAGCCALQRDAKPASDRLATFSWQRPFKTRTIITGEGQVDEQTAFGKTVSGILTAARPSAVPVIILAGGIRGETRVLLQQGAAAVFSICPGPLSLQEAMRRTLPLVEEAMANLTSLLRIAHGRRNTNQNHEDL